MTARPETAPAAIDRLLGAGNVTMERARACDQVLNRLDEARGHARAITVQAAEDTSAMRAFRQIIRDRSSRARVQLAIVLDNTEEQPGSPVRRATLEALRHLSAVSRALGDLGGCTEAAAGRAVRL